MPLAIFLTNPENVQRNDGTQVKVIRQETWRDEMLELWRVCKRKDVRDSRLVFLVLFLIFGV